MAVQIARRSQGAANFRERNFRVEVIYQEFYMNEKLNGTNLLKTFNINYDNNQKYTDTHTHTFYCR
jgi:predicted transcriptional regulator